jgi:hypothetical protein
MNDLRVEELKVALVSDGVPESENVQSKADKWVVLELEGRQEEQLEKQLEERSHQEG